MSYVKVTGLLRGGVPGEVQWIDGEWTALEPVLIAIRRAQREPIGLTPTGPYVPADSERAAPVLAADAFERIDSFETDIYLELEPLPPGAIA